MTIFMATLLLLSVSAVLVALYSQNFELYVRFYILLQGVYNICQTCVHCHTHTHLYLQLLTQEASRYYLHLHVHILQCCSENKFISCDCTILCNPFHFLSFVSVVLPARAAALLLWKSYIKFLKGKLPHIHHYNASRTFLPYIEEFL
jgi:hypothetical protein